MAYTNAVFRIDLVSGNDGARTALTSCTASNPSGTITRITKTAHGLVTGAVVDLTLFSSWLNAAWKITVVDANSFDLDTAVWQATADADGTVTPRGGSSWSDAWLTISTGASGARTQSGDVIRISKTADPVSLGQNASFTDESKTITLTTAVTKKVEDAISGWTAAANVTLGTNTNRKLGATAMTVTVANAFTTGKVCYQTIAGGGTQDFSGYQVLNFWMRPTAGIAIAANTYKICLCSDTTGDTIVDTFNIPALFSNAAWQPFSINLGGNMGASIQSVSIHAIVDPGNSAAVFSLNNIFASAGNLTLKTLIGKNNYVYYNIQSIDGTTISIDGNNTVVAGRGYSGTTESVTLYYREVFQIPASSGTWQSTNEAGDGIGGIISYICGWNTSNDTRDGETVVASAVVGVGTGLNLSSFIDFSYLVLARFNGSIAAGIENNISNCVVTGSATFVSLTSVSANYFSCKFLNNSGSSSAFGGKVFFKDCEFRSHPGSAIQVTPAMEFIGCTFANNGTSSINMQPVGKEGQGGVILRRCSLLDVTEVSTVSTQLGMLWSFDHDNTPGNHWGFTYGGTVNWQTSVVHDTEPGAWKINVSLVQRTVFPVTMRIAEVACNASSLVTVKVWVKKDHATNIGAAIYVQDEDYNVVGVVADDAVKADDTNWEQLTITFTPTAKGIVPIYVKAWYGGGNTNAYFGSIEATQA